MLLELKEAYFAAGSATRPMNRIMPLALSRMKNRNGWSALNSTGGARAADARAMTAAVAAAASVPFSSTFTNALWKTSLKKRRSRGSGGLAIAVKSAWAGEKASVIPRARSASPSGQRAGRIHLELRQAHVHARGGQRLDDAFETLAGQRRLQGRETVDGVGEHDEHRHLAALVGQLHRLQRVLRHEAERLHGVHGGDVLLRGGRDGERRGARGFLRERLRPVPQEVDGVHEHQARLPVHGRPGTRSRIRFSVFSSTQPLMRRRAFSAARLKSTGSRAAPKAARVASR